MAQELIGLKLNQKKIVTIENGIDVGAFDRNIQSSDFKKSLGIGERDTVILTVGRLSPEKGHITIIEAASEILTRIPRKISFCG